jgi:hypothetical protein
MNLKMKLVHEFENEIGEDPWSPIRDPKWIRVSVGPHEFENEIGS